MAFSESYHCDVCGKEKQESSHDWWLTWDDVFQPPGSEHGQPMLQVTAWNVLQAHAAGTRHVCGASCAQTLLNRWMTNRQNATR